MASNTDKKRKNTDISNSNCNTSSYHRYKLSSTPQNPKRGGPGILLTCETGREFKARREALQILQQDWEVATVRSLRGNYTETATHLKQSGSSDYNSTSETRKESSSGSTLLDEEIAQLRQQRSKFSSSSPDSPFVIYETGCKGTVLILYQASSPSQAAPPAKRETSKVQNTRNDDGDIKNTTLDTAQPGENFENDQTVLAASDECIKVVNENKFDWDPLIVVKRIVEDMTLKSPNYTSSRYISRMIPIQRTCYATIEDISTVVQSLLEPIVDALCKSCPIVSETIDHNDTENETISTPIITNKTTTFAIQEKRRFCHQMKREPLITAVGNVVGDVTKANNTEWKVNLSNPDYTIWIDICKTVAGISIIPNVQSYPRNFNLVEHRISLNTEIGSDTEPTR